jgi:hypothetical protein
LVCVAAAALLVWFVLGFSGSPSGDFSRPSLSELFGFTTRPGPPAGSHPNAVATDPPPAVTSTAATQGFDPASAPTVAMVPASRSHVVSSVVAPATSRSTSPAARMTPPQIVSAPAAAPTPPVVVSPSPASASTPTTDVAAPSPVAPKVKAPRHLPADGGIFVGSQSPRRNGSLVSRVRRRQAAVEEPSADSIRETAIDEGVTVISRTPTRHPAPEPWTVPPAAVTPAGPDWGSDTRIEMNAPEPRDLAAAARKTALVVGSRAREAILGYGFPTAPDARTGAPYAGEEPAPGQTVVLEGDDVEAWVRERLYGGRLPPR